MKPWKLGAASLSVALFVAGARSAEPSAAAAHTYVGTFALAGGTAKARAFLGVRPSGATSARLAFSIDALAEHQKLSDFDVEMTQRMHVIVISDDFRHFEHLHPALRPDHRFEVPVEVPALGRYEIYADTSPHGLGQQVFRFSVPFGSTKRQSPDLTPTPRTVTLGRYSVTLDGLQLAAGKSTMLVVKITKDGAPATDLHPYLGGAAHAVFINARTLSYAHVHPMQGAPSMPMRGAMSMPMQDAMSMPEPAELPDGARLDSTLNLHVVSPSRGTYKLWLQFRGGTQLYVAPFILTAA
jgi:hypothetical protein